MYERAFDLDWDSLSAEEALRRMYALGISTELGHTYDDERTRILRIANTAYQRSVLDLAYNEGRNAIRDHRAEYESDEAAWENLIEAKGIDVDPSVGDIDVDETPNELPGAVERASMLDLDVDDLERLKLPKFLRRED
ncbi:hypothetical protein C499_09229 [Halogeometricum borinquense DSM 11551]|uniref:Uncharacterized protein n=2 Tax=Halogeometricum borinquense TaxID=60847 RepID=E4NN41_HALBP|nr:hypothetical protein [Halogeometricum borinquense]ADQ66271.1 hypothetical protein Hbor_06720 [Halogeometricum borinquense DSM 11551]ELY27233.1 hypothetical protein C499_09229 [Halogeometricum borinquense DSM 11551]RYJ14705.1 hypothetical protein ELS19_12590 [Halogeometricum borinquense]